MYGYQALRRLAYEAGAAQSQQPNLPLMLGVWGGGNNAKDRLAQAALREDDSAKQDRAFERQKELAKFTGQDADSKLSRQEQEHRAAMERAQAAIDAANQRAEGTIEQRRLEADQRKVEFEQRKAEFEQRMKAAEDRAEADRREQQEKFWRSPTGQDIAKSNVQGFLGKLGRFGEMAAEAYSTFVPSNPNDPQAHLLETHAQRGERRANEQQRQFGERMSAAEAKAAEQQRQFEERLRAQQAEAAAREERFRSDQARLEKNSEEARNQHQADREEYEFRILTDPRSNIFPASPGYRKKGESDEDYNKRMRALAKERSSAGREKPPAVLEGGPKNAMFSMAGAKNPVGLLSRVGTQRVVEPTIPKGPTYDEKMDVAFADAQQKELERLRAATVDPLQGVRGLGGREIPKIGGETTRLMASIIAKKPWAERMAALSELRHKPDEAKKRGIDLDALTELLLRFM